MAFSSPDGTRVRAIAAHTSSFGPAQFSYGFDIALMKKDVGIGLTLLADKLPHAQVLPVAGAAFSAAADAIGPGHDYTEAVKVVEAHAGVALSIDKP